MSGQKFCKNADIIDKAAQKIALIDAQTARLAVDEDDSVIIALGSTGANIATARLLATIARRKRGAVVLPGLDCDLDETAWEGVGHPAEAAAEAAFTHPQTMLKRLLGELRLKRDDVVRLGEAPKALRERETLLAQALRPADATENWRDFKAAHVESFDAALSGVDVIEAADEHEEALALALFMRQALETPERTAALVTPDRDIARRVAGELARWDIEVDDSGGQPLAATAIGSLARLLAEAAEEEVTAVNVASSSFASVFAFFGLSREPDVRGVALLVEIAVLRTVAATRRAGRRSVAAARGAVQRLHAYRLFDD